MSTDDLSPDERAVLEEWREVIPEMMKSLRVNGVYVYGVSSDEMTLALHDPVLERLYDALMKRKEEMFGPPDPDALKALDYKTLLEEGDQE